MTAPLPLFTIGHSTRTQDEFLALLEGAGIECLVDVRRLPGSTRFPQFDQEVLAAALERHCVRYVYLKALGGLRGRTLPRDDPRNALWRNASFRRYADYALVSTDFAEGLATLERLAASQRTCVMCAEAVWWRCHRRIIADWWLAHGGQAWHLMEHGKQVAATLTPGASVSAGEVTYPAAAGA